MTGRQQPAALASMLMLFAAALLMRSLVPVGWMPAESGFGIRPCVAAIPWAQSETALPRHDGHGEQFAHHQHHAAKAPAEEPSHDNHPGGQGQQPCSFAAFGLAFTAPPEPSAALGGRTGHSANRAAALAALEPARALAAPPPPATGPPQFS